MQQPKFLYANRILKDNITVSSGTANKAKLVDRNEDQVFSAIGESGALTVSVTFPTPRDINRIFIQNTNIKNFTITYNSGSAFTPSLAVTNNAVANLYYEVTKVVAATGIKIVVTTTQDSGEAYIGQFYAGLEIFEFAGTIGNEGDDWKSGSVKQTILEMSDGTTQKVFVRRLLNISLDLINLSDAERTNFWTAYDENKRNAIVFIPYPSDVGGTWDGWGGHYNWTNAFEFYNYAEGTSLNGWKGHIDLVQAGGVR